MPCLINGACRGRCYTPHHCSMPSLFISNVRNGGESVNLEHAPRPMPVQFVGREPRALPRWLIAVLLSALIILAVVGAGALRSHFYY